MMFKKYYDSVPHEGLNDGQKTMLQSITQSWIYSVMEVACRLRHLSDSTENVGMGVEGEVKNLKLLKCCTAPIPYCNVYLEQK